MNREHETNMTDHIWTQEQIATFLADGLEAAEKDRFLTHVRDCGECATALEAARAFDAGLANLFAAVRPGPTLEDRTVRALRTPKTLPTRRRAWGRRVLVGLAATLMIGAVGATGSFVIANGGLPMPGGIAKSPVPWSFLGGDDDSSQRTRREATAENDAHGEVDGLAAALARRNVADLNAQFQINTPSDADETVQVVKEKYSNNWSASRGEQAGKDPFPAEYFTSEGVDRRLAAETEARGKKREDGALAYRETNNELLDAIAAGEAERKGKGDVKALDDATRYAAPVLPVVPSGATPARGMMAPGGGPVAGGGLGGVPQNGQLNLHMYAPGVTGGPAGPTAAFGAIPAPAASPSTDGGATSFGLGYRQPDGKQLGSATTYFDPKSVRESATWGKDAKLGKDLADVQAALDKSAGVRDGEEAPKPKPVEGVPAPAPGTSAPAPTATVEQPVARKIIIRSGDIEFEVESFDSSVATVTLLVTKIKGGYVGTVNSEKLANGKVKGSVVVRVPPEALDGLVLELRKELGKAGELKGQRIGSQDITKMYTDLESRLKAARAMETRLLAIIKDGKGEIKQLLEAEKELGVWRTKIEEYEGELRYYGNLASLSTLTITLAEKDIRVAAGITESERVQAGVEVEDVDKTFRDAMAAVLEAKGRVTRSELKQLSAGQFNAVLNFEVSPDASGPLRDRLKQLGRVARLEIDRVQTADGGPPVKNAKVTRGDTVFLVQFYNLANVAPRETAVLSIAVNDVAASFRTLRDAVEKAKGRVVAASVNEGDKQNVTAQFDFEVKRTEEATLLAALSAAGDTVSKTVSRAPESDSVTDTKVLFRTSLFDAAKLQPREVTTLHLAVADIPIGYTVVQDAVEKAKGRILTAQLHDADRPNVTTQLDFEVKRGDEAAVQAAITGAGDILSRNTVRSPDGTNMTDAKVLLRVTFLNAARMQARETSTVSFAVTDIPAGFREVKAAVEKAKGRIVNSQLNEGDKQNVTAQLDFEVKKNEEAAIFAMLNSAGDVLSRQTTSVAEAMTVTNAKTLIRVTFANAARLKPRETTTLAVEVADVDAAAAVFAAQVAELKGRVVDSQIARERSGRTTGRLVYDVPLVAAGGLAERVKAAGTVRVHQSSRDPSATDGKFATARIDVTLSNADLIVAPDQGVWPQVRKGLSYSASALLSSLTWVIFGLCVVLPWMLVGLVGYRVVRRMTRPTQPATVPTTSSQ
jgi:hypothetical protein